MLHARITSVVMLLSPSFLCLWVVFPDKTLIPRLGIRLQGVGASEAQYREQMEALQVCDELRLGACTCACCCVCSFVQTSKYVRRHVNPILGAKCRVCFGTYSVAVCVVSQVEVCTSTLAATCRAYCRSKYVRQHVNPGCGV